MSLPTSLPRRALLASAVLSTLSLFGACGEKSSPTAKATSAVEAPAQGRGAPTKVVGTPAATRRVPVRLSLDARVQSLSAPTLAAELSATVQQVQVRAGERVRKGQVLVTLDEADERLRLADAHAQVRQAKSLAAEKEADLARTQGLHAQGFVSQAALAQAVQVHAAANEQLAAASAREQLALRAVGRSRVTAPADGVVTAVQVQEGSYVRAGEGVASFWSPGESTLVLAVDQAYLGAAREGQALEVRWQGKTLTSTVSRVSPVLAAGSRSFEVHAQVPPELADAAGAHLSAALFLDATDQLLVPVSAVTRGPRGEASVFMVVEGLAQQVAVSTGAQHDLGVEILEGLAEGDIVVSQGAAFLVPGQRVELVVQGAGA